MFTQEQLNFIKSWAKRTKNQGELAVYREIIACSDCLERFSVAQLNIIKYCAEECKRQRSGEMSVYDMVNAWNYIDLVNKGFGPLGSNPNLTLDLIRDIGQIVEPIDNKKGFRTIPIGVTDGFGGWIEKAPHHRVPALLTLLLDGYYGNGDYTDVVPNHKLAATKEDQFYYEYENIHPFVDGNGRSGKILYNYLLGRLDDPQMPPNFFGGSNP